MIENGYGTIWHLGQFDTIMQNRTIWHRPCKEDNLTPRTIWHHHKFYISTIVWPRNMALWVALWCPLVDSVFSNVQMNQSKGLQERIHDWPLTGRPFKEFQHWPHILTFHFNHLQFPSLKPWQALIAFERLLSIWTGSMNGWKEGFCHFFVFFYAHMLFL